MIAFTVDGEPVAKARQHGSPKKATDQQVIDSYLLTKSCKKNC